MEEIINEIARKYNLSKTNARIICESPFRFLSEVIRDGQYRNINFTGFGKFAVHPRKKEYLLTHRVEILERAEERKLQKNKEINERKNQTDT